MHEEHAAAALAAHGPSWLTLAGTALSGLGATLNGINTLYGLSSQVPHHISAVAGEAGAAVAGGLVSGTVAVAGGCLAAAKAASYSSGGILAAGTGAVSLSTLSIGAGCVYASLGLWHFIRSLAQLSGERPPLHAPAEGSQEARCFPSPAWLNTRVLNWAVVGCVGVGKSTLINSFRGLHSRSPEAAPVGVGHTTRKPRPYSFTGELATLTRNMARLWDLPGAGTKDWPCSSYVRDAGLRHFDGVLLVTCGAFSESEAGLLNQLVDFKVPCYVVRNKVDQDVINNAQDNNVSADDTLAEIRQELVENGCNPSRSFLISAKHPDCSTFDFGALLHAMAHDVSAQRAELPEFGEDLLPFELLFKRPSSPGRSSLALPEAEAKSLTWAEGLLRGTPAAVGPACSDELHQVEFGVREASPSGFTQWQPWQQLEQKRLTSEGPSPRQQPQQMEQKQQEKHHQFHHSNIHQPTVTRHEDFREAHGAAWGLAAPKLREECRVSASSAASTPSSWASASRSLAGAAAAAAPAATSPAKSLQLALQQPPPPQAPLWKPQALEAPSEPSPLSGSGSPAGCVGMGAMGCPAEEFRAREVKEAWAAQACAPRVPELGPSLGWPQLLPPQLRDGFLESAHAVPCGARTQRDPF